MSDNSSEIEITLEANEAKTEFYLVFKSKEPIGVGELILSIEEYLTELTRAESDLRKPGVLSH